MRIEACQIRTFLWIIWWYEFYWYIGINQPSFIFRSYWEGDWFLTRKAAAKKMQEHVDSIDWLVNLRDKKA